MEVELVINMKNEAINELRKKGKKEYSSFLERKAVAKLGDESESESETMLSSVICCCCNWESELQKSYFPKP